MMQKIEKSEEEWRELLTPERYRITRQHGTEPAFTGRYYDEKASGVYVCTCCGLPLYDSGAKFDSGTGWPSFFEAVDREHVETSEDATLGIVRTEIHCARCDSHLGHVFNDGPAPTGMRHCVNSASIDLIDRETWNEREEKRA